MEPLRVVAYARVSSKEQADKELSIPAQLKAIRKYCQDKGWKLVGEYIDEGKSAKTADRPAFQKMIAIAKKQNRHFDAIIVHKFDRFSRSREDHVIYKALLKKQGVTVYSMTEQTDPETPHGFLLEGMLEVISEFYNMNLANETRKGMVENAKRGYHNGGSPPYGYRITKIRDGRNDDKSVWVLGPDHEVDNVSRIFELYVRENKGYKAIAHQLNAENIPGPKDGLWSWTTIWHILHNDAYIGRKTWNKYDYSAGKKKKPANEWIVSADAHPAIIDRDLFNAVSAKSEERNPSGAAFKAKGPSVYILRGLLKCPMCGANMVTGSNGKNTRGNTRYYHCGTYHRKGAKACKRNGIAKEKIESAVLNTLIREFSLLSYAGSLEDEITRFVETQNRETTFQLARIEDDLKHSRRRLELAGEERKSVSQGKYLPQYVHELESEIENLERDKQTLNSNKHNLDLHEVNLQGIRERLRDFANRIKIEPPEVQHRLLSDYVSNIVADQTYNVYKLTLHVFAATESSSEAVKLLEKTVYFDVN